MYESFYGLKDRPFSMLPDPGFLYLGKKHQTALTLMEYALYNNAGFCVISGEIGAGKTTLLRKLLENMEDNVTVGMITNTHHSFGELLDWVLSAFDIDKPKPDLNKVEMHQLFLNFLLEQYARHKTALLIVDEAQNMDVETLEELRMLSNINTGKDQLLQVILAGQPELKDTLRKPELQQFVQRIAVDYHLGALSIEETQAYINHRLQTAGAQYEIFTPLACQRVYEYSGGIPRLINLLCDTAMVYGFADQARQIGESLVDEMVRERMADSLVPLKPPLRSPARKSQSTAARAARAQQLDADKPAAPRLSGVARGTKKQIVKPMAEKKTAPEARKIVPIQIQASAQQASLKAVEAQPEAAELPLSNSEAEPEIATETAPATTAGTKPPRFAHPPVHTPAARPAPPAPPAPRRDNRIEVRIPVVEPVASWLGKWTLAALLVLGLVVLFLVVRGTGEEDVPVAGTTRPAVVSTPAEPEAGAVAAEKQAAIELQQQRAAAALEREQERAQREQLEAEVLELQQQRDAATARAEQEKNERLKQAEAARKAEAARIATAKLREAERQAKLKVEQEAARLLEAEAARQRVIDQELKAAIELEAQRARDLELKSQETARQIKSDAPAPRPTAEKAPAADPELEFIPDPCQGPSAKFLSTCRK